MPRKRMLTRALFACFLVLVAAFSSFIIKDFLSLNDKAYALPRITVMYNATPLEAEKVVLQSYSWRFLLVPHKGQFGTETIWRDLKPAFVDPGSALSVDFSYPCQTMSVSYASGNSTVFEPIENLSRTPNEPGVYTYRVSASWGWLGSQLFYFRLQVPDYQT